jgi:chromosome segregation ATPase
LLIKKL